LTEDRAAGPVLDMSKWQATQTAHRCAWHEMERRAVDVHFSEGPLVERKVSSRRLRPLHLRPRRGDCS